jgi:hypothetical protein
VSVAEDAGATPHHATRHARVVLSDCEAALLELQTASQELLRRRWVTMLALLRAVGHVLGKVDSHSSPAADAAIAERWDAMTRTTPQGEPKILWGFIEQERNNVLKEYQFAVRGDLRIQMPPQGGAVPLAPRTTPPGGIGIITGPVETQYVTSTFALHPFSDDPDNPFAGQDPIAVVRDAIAFWHRYLDEIDTRVAALATERS